MVDADKSAGNGGCGLDLGAISNAVLTLSVGPVQRFISQARTLRDLWSGSSILSKVAMGGINPIIKAFGFDRARKMVILPSLMEKQGQGVPSSEGMPNRFLAIVPQDRADQLLKECRESAMGLWRDFGTKVRKKLQDKLAGESDTRFVGWDRRWDSQIESFIEVYASSISFADAEKIFGDGLLQNPPNSEWSRQFLAAGRMLDASRQIRHVPQHGDLNSSSTFKCTLMGTYEQMGPDDYKQSSEFWEMAALRWNINGIRLRKGERLCAVALTKRFFASVVEGDDSTASFPDTATVAASEWIARGELNLAELRRKYTWSGQWLYSESKGGVDDERCPEVVRREIDAVIQRNGYPPSYYAILMMDADNMGELLRNGKQPEDHKKISDSLLNISSCVPDIVNKHYGRTIYAGGDDVLVILPTKMVLDCASEIRNTFQKIFAKSGFGERTLSAGIAVVHYHEDIRFAMEKAREAEKGAKSAGRNMIQLAICRRSGEHATCLCPWDIVADMSKLIDAFANNAPDGWTYRVRSILEGFKYLPWSAGFQEMHRQISRSDNPAKEKLVGIIDSLAEKYCSCMMRVFGKKANLDRKALNVDIANGSDSHQTNGDPEFDYRVLNEFLIAAQSAAFLARGLDR